KIAGDGPQLQEIKAFIERYDLKNVELLGYLPTDELQQVIRQSRLVIVPSVWHENYSMTLLEAAALGKPLIASNIGGNSEIVKDQFTGLLFEPGNYSQLAEKIKFLYDNESLIREMGQNARKQVEKENSSEQHYSKLMEIYKRAMDKI
ncbi:MAG TPA: glycosyltransferase family 4 protein, partial [Patescibacteria group bacterium]